MRFGDTIEYLYGLQKFGMKFGLDNISKLMKVSGHPCRSFRSVHVGGTNGKGSTAAMIESMIRTGGYKTGLFTSPHLVNFTERMRVNGEEISEADVADLAEEVRGMAAVIPEFSPTFFEVVTTMAFLWFRLKKVEWAVVEVGLGGRLDATNVISPDITVITTIDLDHREFLGNTLGEIAGEKAGIIKERVPVITAEGKAEAVSILEERCLEKNAELLRYGRDFSADLLSENKEGILFRYSGSGGYPELKLPLAGRHQVINAAMALKTVEIIGQRYPGREFDIRRGLGDVKWPGRLEMLSQDPPVLIDGAHNPAAAVNLSLHLKKLLSTEYRRIILVMGIMGDKDIDGILGPLLPLSTGVIFSAPAYGRSAAPDLLASRARVLGFSSDTAPDLRAALDMARERCLPGDLIVVTGSFYTIGEIKEHLHGKGVLSRLRE